jgi:hypothetical protein
VQGMGANLTHETLNPNPPQRTSKVIVDEKNEIMGSEDGCIRFQLKGGC